MRTCMCFFLNVESTLKMNSCVLVAVKSRSTSYALNDCLIRSSRLSLCQLSHSSWEGFSVFFYICNRVSFSGNVRHLHYLIVFQEALVKCCLFYKPCPCMLLTVSSVAVYDYVRY